MQQPQLKVDMKDRVTVIMDLVNSGFMDTATALRSIAALAELPTTSCRSHTEASVRPSGFVLKKEEAEQQCSGETEIIADPATYELREIARSKLVEKVGGGEEMKVDLPEERGGDEGRIGEGVGGERSEGDHAGGEGNSQANLDVVREVENVVDMTKALEEREMEVADVVNVDDATEEKLGSEKEGFNVGLTSDEEREWEEVVGDLHPPTSL